MKKIMIKKINIFCFCATIFFSSSCSENIKIKEQSIGPLFTVCSESFDDYSKNNVIIDSLAAELKKINFVPENTFEIIYNREDDTKRHSIVGCVLPLKIGSDSTLAITLERNRFNVRTIGFTNCITIEVPMKKFNSQTRGEVLAHFDSYAMQHNYQLFLDGKNGLTEIYYPDKVLFAVEIKSNL